MSDHQTVRLAIEGEAIKCSECGDVFLERPAFRIHRQRRHEGATAPADD